MLNLAKIMFYIGRHLVSVDLAALIAALAWTVLYGILLLWACVTSGPIGSPIPLILVFLVGLILVLGWFVFAPACAAGRLVVFFAGWPQLAAIPVVLVAGGLFTYWVEWLYVTMVTTHSPASLDEVLRNYATYLAIPLSIYWAITDGPFALLDVIRRWLRRRSARAGTGSGGSAGVQTQR
jgi:hypothetical protein